MVRRFENEAAANQAIAAAVKAGRCDAGYAQVRFGATNYYTAHVRKGAAGWCL